MVLHVKTTIFKVQIPLHLKYITVTAIDGTSVVVEVCTYNINKRKGGHKMTKNQIDYLNHREMKNNNLRNYAYNMSSLAETREHNRNTEAETSKHNRATERIDLGKLNEQIRTNKANESLKYQSNTIQQRANDEQARHNKASESYNLASLNETVTHNRNQEAINLGDLNESILHNRNSESINTKANEIKNLAILVDKEIAQGNLDLQERKRLQDAQIALMPYRYQTADQGKQLEYKYEQLDQDYELSLLNMLANLASSTISGVSRAAGSILGGLLK